GNGRVRRGMVQLAWRFLTYQKESALAQWYRARTENARGARKPMIVALARKLLIALWRFVWQGGVPDGGGLCSAQILGEAWGCPLSFGPVGTFVMRSG